MKRLVTALLAITLSLLMTATAFAGVGSWRYDGYGWQWVRSNGIPARNEWLWIDGNGDGYAECYCFDYSGYMLSGTYYDNCIINTEGKWVDEYGTPYVVTAPDEWTAYTVAASPYPIGNFTFNSQNASGIVKITRYGNSYFCEYEYDGTTEYGAQDYRYLANCQLYQEDANYFYAVDSYGDTLSFSYYGGNELYNVSYDGSWGEVYYR